VDLLHNTKIHIESTKNKLEKVAIDDVLTLKAAPRDAVAN